MNTITCTNCGLPHALFWVVDKGNKRRLSYRCDKVEKTAHNRATGGQERRSFTETRAVIDVALLEKAEAMEFPEEWTAAYRKEQQNKKQHQFVLMYDKKDQP